MDYGRKNNGVKYLGEIRKLKEVLSLPSVLLSSVWQVEQLVEFWTGMQRVVGSSPLAGKSILYFLKLQEVPSNTKKPHILRYLQMLRNLQNLLNRLITRRHATFDFARVPSKIPDFCNFSLFLFFFLNRPLFFFFSIFCSGMITDVF